MTTVIKIKGHVRAGLYARISQDPTGRAMGVRRQEADCRSLAERMGWEVAEVYVDNDVSAFRGKKRPGYERLLTDLEAGRLNAVVTYHPDRLTRRPVELEHLIEVLDAAGATVATVAGGDYDLGTASGRMVARIIGATARAESERMGERVARKKLELAEAGKPPGGGARPYGYEPGGMFLRPTEADALRTAAADVLAGMSFAQAAKRLNSSGMERDVGPWTGRQLRQVLAGWRVAGVRTYRGNVVGAAAWPAILDPATSAAIQDLAEMRRRGPLRRVPYLLSGVGYCDCGNRLYRRTDKGRSHYYCRSGRGCGAVFALQEPVDEYVTTEIAARLIAPVNLSVTEPADDDRRLEVEARLTALAARHAAGDLTDGEWAALRAPLRAELTDLRRQHLDAIPFQADLDDLAGVWNDGEVVVRNVVLRQLGARVTIRPAGRGSRRPVSERVVVDVP